jgi:ABC-type transport system involved in multi-copper enzyme maturation permease subunit
MTWFRLVRAELRKITTTRLLWGFLAVLALIAALNASLIILATDADGTKGFIATAEDQRTLLAFAYNALFGTALFGAIAAAREYAHNTIVPTMLLAPRRHVAMLAHFTAVLVAGAVLGLAGGSLVMIAGAISMPFADSSLLLSVGTIVQLLAATTFAGATGAVLGAGLGAIVRNPGGAVTAVVLVVFIGPPLVVQMTTAAASWVPQTLAGSVSGIGGGSSVAAAVAVLAVWALIPAVIALGVVQRRDVV